MRGFSEDEFSTALAEALRYFKYDFLKVYRVHTAGNLFTGRCFGGLPTGFGKSLIYQIL